MVIFFAVVTGSDTPSCGFCQASFSSFFEGLEVVEDRVIALRSKGEVTIW